MCIRDATGEELWTIGGGKQALYSFCQKYMLESADPNAIDNACNALWGTLRSVAATPVSCWTDEQLESWGRITALAKKFAKGAAEESDRLYPATKPEPEPEPEPKQEPKPEPEIVQQPGRGRYIEPEPMPKPKVKTVVVKNSKRYIVWI